MLRAPRKSGTSGQLGAIPGFAGLLPEEADAFARELVELGLLTKGPRGYAPVDWSVERIAEHLSLAAAINALAAYQVALHGRAAGFAGLEAIEAALRALDPGNPAHLLEGAYLDYQFHLELVRLSGNRTALAAYRKAIPPAAWLAGANHFQLEEAVSSLSEHERLIEYMRAGDALRARDAVAFHLEEAVAQIRKAGLARIETYPAASH